MLKKYAELRKQLVPDPELVKAETKKIQKMEKKQTKRDEHRRNARGRGILKWDVWG